MFSLDFVDSNSREIIIFLSFVLFLTLVFSVYLYLEISKIKKKNQIFFEGKDGKNLEDVILNQIQESKENKEAISLLKESNDEIFKKLALTVQKVGIIRFNPFGEVGGNQSFALAMLDNHGSGVIILSLYSREGVRIYGKPVQEGKSEYQLTDEEKEALEMAMKK